MTRMRQPFYDADGRQDVTMRTDEGAEDDY